MPTITSHVLVACLFHDIGYVRGILNGDSDDGYIIDAKGNKTELSRGSSDAALLPYHVDRSKLFVMDRFAKSKLLDAARIANAIEFTLPQRFVSRPSQGAFELFSLRDPSGSRRNCLRACGGVLSVYRVRINE